MSYSIFFYKIIFIQIDHVEVWGLGPEPDMSRERAAVKPRRPNLATRGGDVTDMLDLESQIM